MVIKCLCSTEQFLLKDYWLHMGWLTHFDIHQLLQDCGWNREEADRNVLEIFGPPLLYFQELSRHFLR